MNTEKGTHEYTSAVERAIDILEYMATNGRGVSVAELSEEMGVNRTSIYSILKMLAGKGYIRKVSDGRYSLTGRMFEYGQKFRNSFPIVHIVRTLGNTLDLGYDCQLNVAMYFSGSTATIMNCFRLKSPNFKYTDKTMLSGQTVPLYASALGKMLLANMRPLESKKLLEEMQFYPYTENTVRDATALKAQMEEIIAKGYAFEENECFDNIFCVAAPVFDRTNTVTAACSLSCSTLSKDIDKATVIKDILSISRTLSRALGATNI